MSTRRRSPPITGRPIRAKVQTTGTGTADTIGVKRLSNAGVEVGDVIDVYVVDSRLEVDLDSYWPRLDEGAVVRIQQVQGFWHLASPILHNVGKWS
ncbi:MAG: hypothetical protein JW936_01280 [Sedimentisphaerales bacterium]|nr:hypothetical protein [Sedimentisphaerales bacterium]